MSKKAVVVVNAFGSYSVGDITMFDEASIIDNYSIFYISNGDAVKVAVPDGVPQEHLLWDGSALVFDQALKNADEYDKYVARYSALKSERDRCLGLSDFVELPGQTEENGMSAGDLTSWKAKRQELRDMMDKAFKVFNMVGTTDKLELDSKLKGGNDISLEVIDPGTADAALSCDVDGLKITVSLETDGASAIISTVQDVIDEINNVYGEAALLVTASLNAGTASNVVDQTHTETNLAGGVDFDTPAWPSGYPASPLIPGLNDS